jgi:hypothetical protein
MIYVNLPLQFAAVEAEIRSRRLNICNLAKDRASRVEREGIRLYRHRALDSCLRMIGSVRTFSRSCAHSLVKFSRTASNESDSDQVAV